MAPKLKAAKSKATPPPAKHAAKSVGKAVGPSKSKQLAVAVPKQPGSKFARRAAVGDKARVLIMISDFLTKSS